MNVQQQRGGSDCGIFVQTRTQDLCSIMEFQPCKLSIPFEFGGWSFSPVAFLPGVEPHNNPYHSTSTHIVEDII